MTKPASMKGEPARTLPAPSHRVVRPVLVEALAAGAGALGVGVLDGEARLLERVEVVDAGATEVRRAHAVGDHLDTVDLAAHVALERTVVEEQRVAETGAAARLDRDPERQVFAALTG